MPRTRRLVRPIARVLIAIAVIGTPAIPSRGDSVVLKNGVVYRGVLDRDNTIVWVYDGLKRIVVRDSKIARIESDASYRNLEVFQDRAAADRPRRPDAQGDLEHQAGALEQPRRRAFTYEGSRIGKTARMEQAINEMGPHLVKIRGVDGYWQSQLATSQVPRQIILDILAKVDRKDKNERIRVARFLIQAEWYAEARQELDRILADFPDDADLRDRVSTARTSVVQLETVQMKAAIDRCRLAQQPRESASLLKTFPTKDVAADLLAQVQELQRKADAQSAADKTLAYDLRALSERLPKTAQSQWKKADARGLAGAQGSPRRRPRPLCGMAKGQGRRRQGRRGPVSHSPCRAMSSARMRLSTTWKPRRPSGRCATTSASTSSRPRPRPAPNGSKKSRTPACPPTRPSRSASRSWTP